MLSFLSVYQPRLRSFTVVQRYNLLPPPPPARGRAGGGRPRSGQEDRWGDIYASTPVRRMVALYDYDPQKLSPNADAEVSRLADIGIDKCSETYRNKPETHAVSLIFRFFQLTLGC